MLSVRLLRHNTPGCILKLVAKGVRAFWLSTQQLLEAVVCCSSSCCYDTSRSFRVLHSSQETDTLWTFFQHSMSAPALPVSGILTAFPLATGTLNNPAQCIFCLPVFDYKRAPINVPPQCAVQLFARCCLFFSPSPRKLPWFLSHLAQEKNFQACVDTLPTYLDTLAYG